MTDAPSRPEQLLDNAGHSHRGEVQTAREALPGLVAAVENLTGSAGDEETALGRRFDQSTDYQARLSDIEIIFDNITLPVFEQASLALEYVGIFKTIDFGQNVHNATVGRPGILSAVARRLAVPGKTHSGRRKWLERALRIASMPESVISAARKAQVADYQTTLLEIAQAGGNDEQLEKIKEIRARKVERQARRSGPKLSTVILSQSGFDQAISLQGSQSRQDFGFGHRAIGFALIDLIR